MDEPSVLVSRQGAVSTVTLNRPHRKNAIDVAMWAVLRDAFRAVADDSGTRVVVVTGAGGDFCAGADLGEDRGGAHPLERMRLVNSVALALHELPKPSIAKVEGVAVGAGWNLALGCDLVACSTGARFSQIFARRGLSPDFGGSWLLPRLVGLQQAKRLALLADFVGPEQALELGLVTWVREPGELDEFVAGIAKQLADGPPVALAQTKALLTEGATAAFPDALRNEARAQTVNFATEDTAAAFEAFLSKTTAEYTGRWAVR
ncbi:enoyl-CoA hydratase/isomerase family protein [Amycolatopsis acididurans]|uniref:enoyl-CoA hydratase/isomerase family protein n=1 Tax=Amycolatopsis acididurans TaxID=2724524 RepID=UPI0028ADCFC9|nr:enoyl-CoA hydratase-related protein [Amycolatopsis acididurans]